MLSVNFVIGILLCSAAYVLSDEELNCHLQGESYDGTVNVKYDRQELAIYKYNNTRFVNFLLHDIRVLFNGVFTSKKEVKIRVGLKTDVEGIAKLEVNKEESSLTDCHFNLKKNAKYADNVSLEIQVKIIELAHACIKTKLCENLGNAQADDFIRAKIDHYDFGENSVMFDAFTEKYPKLNLPNPIDNNLQNTINLLADFWLASLITQMSNQQLGQINLPDVNETLPGVPMINQGYFKLSGGTFGNLRSITRSKDVVISHRGLEFSVQGEFRLPVANIHFDEYVLKYGLLGTNGKIDVEVNGITFYLKVIANYNDNPCKIAVPAIQSKIGDISVLSSDNGIFDSVIDNITNNIVNRYIRNIVSYVESKIKKAINEPLNGFDCEKYRP